jgi:hypothetical protein
MANKKIITVTDGIINPKVFEKEETKLLWILKEPNDEQSKEDWDMCEFLRCRSKKEKGLFNVSHWHASFGLICKISWGILEPAKTYNNVNKLEGEDLAKVLDRIAFINIKKVAGKSVLDYRVFHTYCERENAVEKVNEQIAEINPNFIMCGNTFQYLYPDLPGFNYNKDWIYEDKNIVWINGNHPNARIKHEKYYNDTQKD